METSRSNKDRINSSSLMGFYSWDVSSNLVLGDESFAAIYGIPAEDVSRGVPVETILALIDERDRGPLARYIHGVLLGGKPEAARYIIIDANGSSKSACSIGSVIMDTNGLPILYAGAVVCPVSASVFPHTSLRDRIVDAIELAKSEGHDITRKYLSSALGSLGALGK